jgi:hypothetical protein
MIPGHPRQGEKWLHTMPGKANFAQFLIIPLLLSSPYNI